MARGFPLHVLGSQTWKDKFVGNYITIGGAWSGCNFLLQMLISSKYVGIR